MECRILEWHRQDETSGRLATTPGIGRSPPAPWRPARRIRRCSNQAGSSRLGWGSRRAPRAVAVRNAKPGSARWATAIFDAFWSLRRRLSCEWPPARTRGLGGQSARTQNAQGCRRGLGQQDRSHSLNPDGATGGLRAHDGVEIGPVSTRERRRRRKVVRRDDEPAAAGGTGETQGVRALERVDVIREPVRRLHQGRQRTQLHQQAEQMTAFDRAPTSFHSCVWEVVNT